MGGGLAAAMAQGQFQPLGRVILDMPQVGQGILVTLATLSQEQQARLTSSVMEAVKKDFTDPMVLVRLATTDNALKTAVMSAVAAFMR